MQVLDASLPVGLAAVDCTGSEASLLACPSDDAGLLRCAIPDSNATDATVLACGNTTGGGGHTLPNRWLLP